MSGHVTPTTSPSLPPIIPYAQITRDMLAAVNRYATPISISHGSWGQHWGTGSYLEDPSGALLLSNEHVLALHPSQALTHKFRNLDTIWQITGPCLRAPHPLDGALARVAPAVWQGHGQHGGAVPSSRIAPVHAPVDCELLFVYGFAGQNARFAFGTMVADGTGYLCQETPGGAALSGNAFNRLTSSGVFDPALHFAVEHRPGPAHHVVGNGPLPLPAGMSGSLVWNTRYYETVLDGGTWNAGLAQVTGLVWGWDSTSGYLVATRIEQVNALVTASIGVI